MTGLLGLPSAAAVLEAIPMSGSFDSLPPADPTISRFYEMPQLYGPALKALINEDFGGGS